MKAIMYHYVRPENKQYPFFKFLHIDDFKKQLDFFGNTFGFLGKAEFFENISEKKVVHKGVMLTFDDSIKDHYNYVFPELLRRKLWGIFYIPTYMYKNNKLLDVHKIHLILGKLGGKKALQLLQTKLQDGMLAHKHRKEFRELTYKRQVNDDHTLLFKRILNYFIADEWKTSILDELITTVYQDEGQLCEEHYLSKREIIDMHKAGMVIGSHSVTHPVISKLAVKEQEKEICNSICFIENLLGSLDIRTFCYPYGGFHSFTDETEQILQRNNFLFTFNVEQRDINDNDINLRPQALPRYDCNQYKYGTASYLQTD